MLCWLSAANNQPHWVKLEWEKPRRISEVTLFWMSRNGLPLQRGIETLQDGVWKQTVPPQPAGSAVETIRFAPVEATGVKIMIPAGKGSRHLPSMVGLSEVEIR